MQVYAAAKLEALTAGIFEAYGAPPDIASQVARSLVESNLMGHDSHGILRVLQYVGSIEKGGLAPAARPSIFNETPTTATIDGNWAFGQVTAKYATEVAIEKARTHNVAAVGMIRLNHLGRLGEWTEMAAKEGMFAYMSGGCQTLGPVAPYGGAARTLGTNPIAISMPGGGDDAIVADMATCVVAEGKLRVARAKGLKVAPGTIMDKNGDPTNDPEDFYAGGAIHTFAGHKGHSLSVVAELAARFIAPGETMPGKDVNFGAFLTVVNIPAFRPLAEFQEAVGTRVGEIKGVRLAEGFSEIMMPGDPERKNKASRKVEGVPMPEDTINKLAEIAGKFAIPMPEPIA